jgi:hypothetical protein
MHLVSRMLGGLAACLRFARTCPCLVLPYCLGGEIQHLCLRVLVHDAGGSEVGWEAENVVGLGAVLGGLGALGWVLWVYFCADLPVWL